MSQPCHEVCQSNLFVVPPIYLCECQGYNCTDSKCTSHFAPLKSFESEHISPNYLGPILSTITAHHFDNTFYLFNCKNYLPTIFMIQSTFP